jgi:glycosyltransferase involved in cell wall biosynthesis/nucleotide-binding universal stress UspA family protein
MSPDAILPKSIVIPLANPRTAADLVRIGAALLQEGGAITALSIVEVPEGVQLSEGATRARQARRLLQRVLEFVPEGVELRTIVRIGRRADEGIVELAAEEEADLILFGWGGPERARRSVSEVDDFQPVFSPTIDEVIRERPCDIAVVKQRGITDIKRIVAPVRGGPHAELALRYASALSGAFEAKLDALHVVSPNVDPAIKTKAERNLELFVERHTGVADAAKVVQGDNVTEAILHEAESAELVIMGATATAIDSPGAPLFGQLVEHVAQEAKPTVIVVKTRDVPTRATFVERARQDDSLEAAEQAAAAVRSLPAKVDRWFGESSFDYTEFSDLKRLVELKEKRGLTISAVLPTLNEAETIGPIVRSARRELMKIVPLIDELLVIDSDSDDETRKIAEDEGARVVTHQQVLPKYGAYAGKGEALWKSLYETSGDLVAWCDTDVREWDPRFLYGTLGPLLTEPRFGYVKAYYQRPIVQGGVLTAGGGGRVTELVARPLINLFFPELSGYIQPLSGEYAGRREYLEDIPFFASYAVEIGHLIDLSQKLGIEGLGQVDLETRHHRNQDLEGLSKMAFVIMHAVMKRLEERGQTKLLGDLGSSMKLPRSSAQKLSLDVFDLADIERPPMSRIPEYRRKRGLPENPTE